jgi:hypothetical protein
MFTSRTITAWLCAQLLLATQLTGLSTQAAETKAARPHMDLAFCIDTTSSMQSEIDMVKTKTKELVAKLGSGHPAPIIRVGLVAFRDRGDEYVTKVFPFTEDVDKIVKDISSLAAVGGGDGPESVNEALHVAVNDLKWDTRKGTTKVLFLIGDAAPHHYANDFNWNTESRKAINSGIQINTIGCGGLDAYPAAEGVDVFKKIALLTDGKYEPLAYRQEVVNSAGRKETLISSGSAVYRVKSARADAWKEGAAKLEARGMLEKIATPASPVRGRAFGATASFAAEPMSASTIDRKENNLADVLLQGALSAAKKSH